MIDQGRVAKLIDVVQQGLKNSLTLIFVTICNYYTV